MSSKQNDYTPNTVSMLTYWTRRYVLVLLGCLLLLALAAGIWIRIDTYEHIYSMLELRAEQLVDLNGQAPEESEFSNKLRQMEAGPRELKQPFPDADIIKDDSSNRKQQMEAGHHEPRPPIPEAVHTVDTAGNIQIIKKDENAAIDTSALFAVPPSYQNVLAGKNVREQVHVDSQTWLRVGVPVYQNGTVCKALYISMPVDNQIRGPYGLLALLTVTITLAGWLVLYFLSRRLIHPLREVAAAAQSIAEGNYDPVLPREVKERELQQLIESFRHMAAQLKQLEQLRSVLLAGVSHELRTPITSIRGMIQAVHDKIVTGAAAEEFLQISWNEAKRLQQMVEELLDFSSFEAGAAPIRGEPVNLSSLINEVIHQLSVLPEFSKVRFEPALPAEPVWVNGDAGRLRQMFINLFDNSKKAAATLININFQELNQQIILDIEDDGKGIDTTDQPFIFERFYRGSARQAIGRGLGLGLTISRLLAHAHGGDLVLLRTSAAGTTFRLSLTRYLK
ncbi:HAMP domain-containing histidine kinase [Pelotomaculum isophthalicicum JI]|uniref:histidine kinase n=1 Tax=Pelotomaculum isophthalicicum JI TaxID=947010 RepID=A0A9X4H649_9FIRM|nr:HAMP domain-containing sensor histidine kinase [Pelotomaculum isophthalicicum]MDF9408927.1 HAMP domain-containing histidine kinase [Pelotomaculum isophthalicicum JI]